MSDFVCVVLTLEDLPAIHAACLDFKYLPYAYFPEFSHAHCVEIAVQGLKDTLVDETKHVLGLHVDSTLVSIAIVEGLEWDSAIFKRSMGRVRWVGATEQGRNEALCTALFRECIQVAQSRGFMTMDLQVHVLDIDAMHGATAAGFKMMATHVIMVWDLTQEEVPYKATEASIETADVSDASAVGALCALTHPRYSRFALDKKLAGAATETIFHKWASNCVLGRSDRVQVAKVDGDLAGFGAWMDIPEIAKVSGEKAMNFELAAVAPAYQRCGVFGALSGEGTALYRGKGYRYLQAWTHLMNVGIQRGCAQYGAVLRSGRHTLHWHAD